MPHRQALHLRPNPVVDRAWLAADAPLLEVRAIGMNGAVYTLPFSTRGGTAKVDVKGLDAGAYTVWARTGAGVSTARFIKQ